MDTRLRRELISATAVGAGFFAVALLSLLLSREAGRIAAVWPANAVLLVALLKAPPGGRGLRLAAAWIGNVAANLTGGDDLIHALGLSAANSLEVGVCLLALTRFVGREVDLTRPRDLTVFGIVAVAGPLLSGACAASFLYAVDKAPWWGVLKVWWPTDALGLMIFTPALLIVADGSGGRLLARDLRGRATAMSAVLALSLVVVFGQNRFPLLFVIPPILVLMTFRLGLAGAAWGILATAVASMGALLLGLGPTMLAGPDLASRVFTLQVFLAFLVIATLPLASVLGVQRRLEASLLAARNASDASARLLAEANGVAAMAERMAALGYWLYRPDTREVVWSDEMFRIYGLDPAGGVPDFDTVVGLYHPEDREAVRASTLRSLDTGEPYELELRLGQDPEIRWVIASTQLQPAADGGPATLLGTLVEVTKLRRAETALVESEARYRQLAEVIPDLILRTTPDGVIRYASPACRQYGYEPEALVGRPTLDFVHPDDIAAARQRTLANASEGRIDPSIRREQRIRTAAGAWVWLEGKPSQIRDETGQVVEIVNAFRDVTRRRALEDELNEARQAADRANQAKSDFLSNMSHELRTPLSAIIGFASLLKSTGQLTGRDAMFAERIGRAGESLLGLVNDILDVSKLEAGGLVLEQAPVDLAVLADESLALVAGAAEAKGLTLSADVPADLPIVTADSARLRQVLVNLLGNAVKFTDSGSVRLAVSFSEGRLAFAVSDTGIGIPPDRLAQIFERFTQADGSTTRTHGGTGLGLAISKGLVEAMGGSLSVDSRLGTGSTFAFSLPAVPARDSAPRSARQ